MAMTPAAGSVPFPFLAVLGMMSGGRMPMDKDKLRKIADAVLKIIFSNVPSLKVRAAMMG